MQAYTTVIAGSSTNVRTPTAEELNQGNDQFTVFDSSKNNGYYRQMSAQIASMSAELINVITAGGVTPSSSTNNLITALQTFFTPTGSVITHAANTAPTGFLICDGSAISRTTYATLFSVIGTTWGVGNGSTTFNLPDLRGQFIRGWAASGSVDSGRVFASNQTDSFASHNHSYTALSKWGANAGPETANWAAGDSGGNNATGTMSNTGGTETRPVNVALLYCIKF